MWRLATSALVLSALLQTSTCHKCSDGSPVTCTAVQSTNGAPAINGKKAQDFPACTPEGQSLLCLVNHDYHLCADGMEPCCLDGSRPSHNGAHTGDDPKIDCKTTGEVEAQKVTGQLNKLSGDGTLQETPNIDPIVLDDFEALLAPDGGAELTLAWLGYYEPCLADAYNSQFHHDGAHHKNKASFTFKFTAPASGCYVVEEYHPGSNHNCSRYLPRNAQLDVVHHGGISTLYINQAQRAAQFNEIGMFMFTEGAEGRLIMRNSWREQCLMGNAGACFWVVDAFRLTWKAHQCPEVKMAEVTIPVWTEGLLVLRLSLAEGVHSDSVMFNIQKHKTLLESTLAAHLGYKNIYIASVAQLGRRLQDELQHDGITFHIPFTAHEKILRTTDQNFKETVQASFDAISPGVTVEKVDMQWPSPSLIKAHEHRDVGDTIALLFAILSAFFILLVPAIWLAKQQSRRHAEQLSAKKNKETSSRAVVAVESAIGREAVEPAIGQQQRAVIDDLENASTASPVSDPTPSHDDTASEANSATPTPSVQTDEEAA